MNDCAEIYRLILWWKQASPSGSFHIGRDFLGADKCSFLLLLFSFTYTRYWSPRCSFWVDLKVSRPAPIEGLSCKILESLSRLSSGRSFAAAIDSTAKGSFWLFLKTSSLLISSSSARSVLENLWPVRCCFVRAEKRTKAPGSLRSISTPVFKSVAET